MERRDFLKGMSAAGLLSLLDPAYLKARESLQAGETPTELVPKRPYGRANDLISVIGFGGIVVMNVTPEAAARYVAEAVDRGVNYFDVAPTYGNAQERLGPALKPHRERCFLACKTTERDAAGRSGNWRNRCVSCRPTTSTCTSFTPSRLGRMSNGPSHRVGQWRSS